MDAAARGGKVVRARVQGVGRGVSAAASYLVLEDRQHAKALS